MLLFDAIRGLLLGCIFCAAGCHAAEINLGKLGHEAPKRLRAPAAKGEPEPTPPAVSLYAVVVLSPDDSEQRPVYLLVKPMLHDTWWVQRPVYRRERSYLGKCQFGEPNLGVGEEFAILGVATDLPLRAGQELLRLPSGSYTKPKLVTRSR